VNARDAGGRRENVTATLARRHRVGDSAGSHNRGKTMFEAFTRPLAGLLLAAPLLAVAPSAAAQDAAATPSAAAAVDLTPFVRKDTFETIVLSPTGEYLAATVPLEDRTGLVIMRRTDKAVTARFTLGRDTHLIDPVWVNDGRVLASVAEAFGTQDTPSATGELFGVDVDGKNQKMLVGYRAETSGQASRLQGANNDAVFAELVDELPAEDNYVLVAVTPFVTDPHTRLERMDVRSGKRTPVTRVAGKYAAFVTDNARRVRIAAGRGKRNESLLFYRADDDAAWTVVNDELKTGLVEFPIGFSPDDRVVYLQSERAGGPDAIVAWDTSTGERKEVARHATHDPYSVIYALGDSMVPVGVRYDTGPTHESLYFGDPAGDARIHRMLDKAFAGLDATVTSTTRDGNLALVLVDHATSAGDFFLFDVANKKADLMLSAASWLDPAAMGQVRAVTLKARDGQTLHGVLTLPPGSAGKGLPMVVNPHGGPFGIRDGFEFNHEAQLLAHAGYAVLQVNFRGSGGYGRDYHEAGAKQWGKLIQDDIVDATKWAIAEGIADGRRVCIYGGSHGGYASVMALTRDPGLFRCAAGYVGVYDLDRMVSEDSSDSASSAEHHRQWTGEKGKLGDVSPTRLADRIKAPVFLAAGGEDTVAPVEHTRAMEAALRKAGVPVETLYYKNEGHGFYTEEHRRGFYAKLLDFLSRNLGGAKAAGGAVGASD
jgi:dipeptidyl aminopeptidase/acylaminoacyl peptidase